MTVFLTLWPSASPKSKFRSSLLARDGRCLLTQAERSMCTSAHVVPVTRLDVSAGLRTKWKRYAEAYHILIQSTNRSTACFSVFNHKDNSTPRLWAFWFETTCTNHTIDTNGVGTVKWVKEPWRSYLRFGKESLTDTCLWTRMANIIHTSLRWKMRRCDRCMGWL